ncbi:unnamed protein product [Prunus armeniaca]
MANMLGAIGCSYVFVRSKGPSWLAEFKGIWFQSSDHLVDATLAATEVKSSELSIRNDSEEKDLMNIFASLSLKPSNLPARDAPWKWVTSPFKMLHMWEASSLMQPHLENSLVG